MNPTTMNPVFGIDLGTTNSVIAWVRNGTPEVLSVDGAAIVPSVVGLDASGALVCGNAARNQLAAYPERTVASIKRRMGTTQTVRLGDRELSPPEVSALILKDLARRGEAATGVPVRRVVITVPAFFQDAQRAATRRAGELAGLEVVRLVNEPTAAALAFEGGASSSERTLLVYDLGGGTFDCSIVTTDGELVEVIASHGDVLLGGDDFDRLLAERLLRGLDAGLLDEPATRYRLLQAAEAAKCRLTEDVTVKVREEFLKQGPPPVHLDAEVERDDFERLIAPLLERTLDSVHRALEIAGRSLNQIDDVLLVGGQTRTPLVAERLRALLGKPPRRDLHPDLCVALGAAIAGARHSGAKTERVLVDVTPYSFGTSYLGELDGEESPNCYKVVIERGSPLPVTRSETFYTAAPFQEAIDAQIFQGECADARDNILIGRFLVDDLTPMPTHNPVVFRMQLGLDGILHVEVQERSTGKTRRVRIDGATAPPTAEQLAASKSRVDELWGDDADDDAEDTAGETPAAVEDWTSELRMLIARARSLMTSLADEDQREIEALIADAEDALDRADHRAGADVHRELEDLVHYAEEG